MSKRAAIYARVSTREQKNDGYSLQTQVEACRTYATERCYVVATEPFQDDVTGMSMDRPALDRLRMAIATHHIEVVIIYDVDRLARKAVYQVLLEQEFARLGAVIEYASGWFANSEQGPFRTPIRAAAAEIERASMLERVQRGTLASLNSGKVRISVAAPFGYHRGATTGTLVIRQQPPVNAGGLQLRASPVPPWAG